MHSPGSLVSNPQELTRQNLESEFWIKAKEAMMKAKIIPSTEAEVYNALNVIITNKKEKSLNYAVGYAQAGLSMTGYELYIQCLYVLNNMTHWKTKTAAEVRDILRRYFAEAKDGE